MKQISLIFEGFSQNPPNPRGGGFPGFPGGPPGGPRAGPRARAPGGPSPQGPPGPPGAIPGSPLGAPKSPKINDFQGFFNENHPNLMKSWGFHRFQPTLWLAAAPGPSRPAAYAQTLRYMAYKLGSGPSDRSARVSLTLANAQGSYAAPLGTCPTRNAPVRPIARYARCLDKVTYALCYNLAKLRCSVALQRNGQCDRHVMQLTSGGCPHRFSSTR